MQTADTYYPITLTNLKGTQALVVGGGSIAERKVRYLLQAVVDVIVISPSATEQILRWHEEGRIDLFRREYQKGDCSGATLVFATTDSNAVNTIVAGDAKDLGVLCNVVSDPAQGTFHLPAVYRGESAMVSVSSYGLSPQLAIRLRDKIAAWIEDEDVR